jgi:hypothetical protein
MRRILFLPALALSACGGGGGVRPDPTGLEVTLGGKRFEVTLLATEKERRAARADLPGAPEGRGHLLAWPRERFIKLEGEDARASFDVAFLDRSGRVADLQELPKGGEEGIMSRAEAAYALLAAPGALRGVRTGDVAALSPGLRAARPAELPLLRIGGATATVELALTEADRQHGLMFRPRMSADDGMLFAYPDEYPRSFWMKNTFIPLDIAFFKADGTLLNVNETPTAPNPRVEPVPTSPSEGPARFVLEMNRGWFRRKGLLDPSGRPLPGLKAELPPQAFKGSFD